MNKPKRKYTHRMLPQVTTLNSGRVNEGSGSLPFMKAKLVCLLADENKYKAIKDVIDAFQGKRF